MFDRASKAINAPWFARPTRDQLLLKSTDWLAGTASVPCIAGSVHPALGSAFETP